MEYIRSKHALLLRELACDMWSHSITCQLAAVTLLPVLEPITADNQFSEPWTHTKVIWYSKMVTHLSTNQAQCWVAVFMRQAMLAIFQTANQVHA